MNDRSAEQSVFPGMTNVGLTKRELFAMAAMHAILSAGIPGSHNQPKNVARDAKETADELLKELER